MKLDALLNVDVVAVETADQLSALVQLTAPSDPGRTVTRTPSTLVVVLDRSGSMRSGGRLAGAKTALLTLIDQLSPTDRFGLVTFDDAVRVDVPAGPLTDKPAVKRGIAHIQPGGTTDLSSGYLRGLQEARRAAGPDGATVLLISDGHANAGITDAEQLASIASTFAGKRVSTSAMGYGLGYDERLLSAVAKGGQGNELFAEDPDQAGALIAGEVDGLLSQTVQAASLLVRVSPAVKQVALANDMVVSPTPDGLLVELGGFWADEERKLLLTFDVPGLTSHGLTQVATLELTYVDVALMMEQAVSLPLHVNVVPGDEAAGRISNPFVLTEMAFLAAQASKREASRRLSAGDSFGAVSRLRTAHEALSDAMAEASPQAHAELQQEAGVIDQLRSQAEHGDMNRSAKRLSSDSSTKSRQRGRRPHNR
ncbi:MAG: VWA domain-containing protein [Actinomycetota bacterium]|nr:VWA domain-containing protein [Actinomycetota bacterium]